MPKIWELQRLSPRGHSGERLLLDASRPVQLLGRSRRCAIRLYSASASREHAEIQLRGDGEWVVQARPGRIVVIDGGLLEGESRLCEGLQLAFGADRLRVQTPRLGDYPSASPTGSLFSRTPGALLGLLGVLAAALLLLLVWRLRQ